MAVNSGINWLYYSDGGRQLYVLNLSDPDFKFPSIPFECALPDNCRITMLKVSVDNLALFVGVETDRPEKYKGDVYKINAKDGTILEHYQRFGGTPVDMVEKKSVEYDVNPGGQAIQCSTMQPVNLTRLPIYSLAIIVLTTGAGVWIFKKKDLK